MERLPIPEANGYILPSPRYSARSIVDMADGRKKVIEERRREIELWREEFHGISK